MLIFRSLEDLMRVVMIIIISILEMRNPMLISVAANVEDRYVATAAPSKPTPK